MLRQSFACASLLVLPLLAACGGGGSLPQGSALPAGAPVTSQGEARASTLTSLAPASSGVFHRIYVGNRGNNSITVYNFDDNGNVAPNKVIAGPKTGITSPGALTEDASGNLYVANGYNASGVASKPGVLVFARGASGNVAPIRTIAGSATGIVFAAAIDVDQSSGDLIVLDSPLNGPCGQITYLLKFSPTANGNVAPLATSADVCLTATQVTPDSTGKNLIWAALPYEQSWVSTTVSTVGNTFSNGTSPTVDENIVGFQAQGVADDESTKTFFATSDAGIYRMAEDTTGIGPDSPGQLLKPAPLAVITSVTCGGQLALAPGANSDLYVVESTLNGCASNAIAVFNHSATANATPVRVISGSATRLNEPYGITEGL